MPATIAVYGKANVQQWDRAIKKAQELRGEAVKSAGGTGGAFSKLGGVISSTGAKIASGLAAAGVVSWLKSSIDVAKQAEVTQGQLRAAVESSGTGWAGYAGKMDAAVSAASRVSAYSKGELKSALTQLTTTTGKAGKSLDLLGVTQDLARRKGMSLEQAAVLVGKAYNGNVTSLKKLGIELPKGAKGMQAVDAIQKRVAGSAKAYGDSAAGAQDKFNNTLKGLQKTVGETLLPILNKFMVWLGALLTKFDTLSPSVKGFIIGIAGIAAAALMIAPFVTAIQTVVGAMQLAKLAQIAWTAAQWLFNAAMSANPIGLIIIAVVALVGVIVYAWTHCKAFRDIVIGVWNAVKNAAVAVWKWIIGAFKAGVAAIAAAWNAIKSAAVFVWNWLVAAFKKYGLSILAALTGPIGALVIFMVKNWSKIKDGAVTGWNAVVAWVKGVPGRILSALGKLDTMLYNAGRAILQGFLNGLKSMWDSVTGWISGIGQWIKDHKGPIDYDRTLLVPHGMAIMEGLHSGLKAGWKPVAATLDGYTRSIGSMNAHLGLSVAGGGSLALGGGGGSFGGSGGSYRAGNVTIMPGAVQITFPSGTSATPADVDAAVERGLKKLADAIRRG